MWAWISARNATINTHDTRLIWCPGTGGTACKTDANHLLRSCTVLLQDGWAAPQLDKSKEEGFSDGDSKRISTAKEGILCTSLTAPSALTCAEIQPYPSSPKMPTFKTLPLWGIGWQYKWHHEIINDTWVNSGAVTHRAVFIRTNDTNLRCKQVSARRRRAFNRINSKPIPNPQTWSSLVNPRLPKHHLKGNLRALSIDIFCLSTKL